MGCILSFPGFLCWTSMLTRNHSLSLVKWSNMFQLASSIYIQQRRMEEEEVVAVVGNYVMMEHGDGYKNPVHMIRFAKVTTAMPPTHTA